MINVVMWTMTIDLLVTRVANVLMVTYSHV